MFPPLLPTLHIHLRGQTQGQEALTIAPRHAPAAKDMADSGEGKMMNLQPVRWVRGRLTFQCSESELASQGPGLWATWPRTGRDAPHNQTTALCSKHVRPQSSCCVAFSSAVSRRPCSSGLRFSFLASRRAVKNETLLCGSSRVCGLAKRRLRLAPVGRKWSRDWLKSQHPEKLHSQNGSLNHAAAPHKSWSTHSVLEPTLAAVLHFSLRGATCLESGDECA